MPSAYCAQLTRYLFAIAKFLFTEIWRFYDFQNGGRPPSWILKTCSFCHVALVDMPFCFLIQNFAEIGQSVDELWPKKRFSRWRPPPSWILKISILVTRLQSGSPFAVVCRISSKSDDFSLRYGDLTIFKMAAGILKICSFCHVAIIDMPCCFLIQNFTEIGQLVDELWPKKRFSRWRPPPPWT